MPTPSPLISAHSPRRSVAEENSTSPKPRKIAAIFKIINLFSFFHLIVYLPSDASREVSVLFGRLIREEFFQ